MKVIAISAVTAGGKTTVVNALERRFPKACALHFDDYSFEGEVHDFHRWVLDGADYHVWNLTPLEEDIIKIKKSGKCDYLLLDYPFAYCHEQIKKYIDIAIFIDTPLDVALARQVLRDMADASGNEIRNNLEMYLRYARIAFLQMHKDILPLSDYVIDGMKSVSSIVDEIVFIVEKNQCFVRKMELEDIPFICKADNDESEENINYLIGHIERQNNGECTALLAIYEGEIAGYVFVYFNCRWGALKNQNLPGIVDLIVFEKYRRCGIATKLMNEAEIIAKKHGVNVYLDVCLNSSYGAAQIFYIKRGYVPDGKGVYYEEKVCPESMKCVNDDELTICLVKELV